MGGYAFAAMAVALVTSCTQSNPAVSCAEGSCSDPAYPYCDMDGVVTGETGVCVAVTCEPGETIACAADEKILCPTHGHGL